MGTQALMAPAPKIRSTLWWAALLASGFQRPTSCSSAITDISRTRFFCSSPRKSSALFKFDYRRRREDEFPKEGLLQDADRERVLACAVPLGDELGKPILGHLDHVLLDSHLEHFLGISSCLATQPQKGNEIAFILRARAVQVLLPLLLEDVAVLGDERTGEEGHLPQLVMGDEGGVLQQSNIWIDVHLAVERFSSCPDLCGRLVLAVEQHDLTCHESANSRG